MPFYHPRPHTVRKFYAQQAAATRIQAVVRRKQTQKTYKNLKLSRPVATLVEKRINRNIQTQHTAFHQRRYQFTNLISDAPLLRIHTVIPDIDQGDERHDRVGSKIKLTSCNIKGRLDVPADDNPAIGNDDRAQIYVRLFCLSAKGVVPLPELIADWNSFYNSRFFKNQSSAFAPTGEYLDMLSSVNRDVFTVHYDRVFKMDRHAFYPDPTLGNAGATNQIPVSREFNINLKVKNKMLTYSVPGATQSQNFQPFICALFCYGNGANPSTSAVPFIEYLSQLTFKR